MSLFRDILLSNTVSALQLRDYEQLFFGSNQEEGYDKPFLEFTSDTIQQILKADRITYFHFPNTSKSQEISATRLIQNGACSGPIPFKSDRIYKKLANYKKHIYWGDASLHKTDFIDTIVLDNSTIITEASSTATFTTINVDGTNYAIPLYKYDTSAYTPLNIELKIGGGISTFSLLATSLGGFVGFTVNNSAISFPLFESNASLSALHLLDATIFNESTATGEFFPLQIQGIDYCIPLYTPPLSSSSVMRRVIHKPEYGETGEWICTWLSAGYPLQDPIWVDRYYIPGDGDDTYDYNYPTVYDIKSEMLLDPGVWYKYFHIGNTYNQFLVDSLTGTTSALQIHLDDWDLPITTDLSPYGNDCILNDGNGVVQIVNSLLDSSSDNAIYVSGGGFGEVVYDSSISQIDDFSVAFWARTKDWNNIPGNHIVSKNFRGGWSVSYDCGFCNPFFAVFDNSGVGLILNQNGKIITEKTLPSPSRPIVTQPDSNYFVWILDSHPSKRRVYKMDFDGTINTEIVFDDSESLQSMTLSSDETVVVYNSSTGSVSAINNFGEVISTQSMSSGYRTITIDVSGNLVGSEQNDFCMDNLGRKWEANISSGIKRTYNSNVNNFYTGVKVKSIECGADENIWFTFGQNNFAIIDPDSFNVITSGSLGTTEDIGSDPNIGLSLAKEIIDDQRVDVAWVSIDDNQKIYKIDSSGNLLDTIDVELYNIGPYQTRFTSYDWHRKFNYLKYNTLPQIKMEMHLGTEFSPVCGKYTLSVPACSLANDDWHLFSLTKCSSGDVRFFVDCLERDSVNVPNAVVYYDYENSLFLGTNAGKILPLDKELKEVGLFYSGYIDDIRIYDYVLDTWDFWFIHNNKQDYQDINWNMDTGDQAYLEEIERFFKFKLPGQKSQFFNIRITGLNINDQEVRDVIEGIIRDTIKKVVPSHSMLYKIIWQ